MFQQWIDSLKKELVADAKRDESGSDRSRSDRSGSDRSTSDRSRSDRYWVERLTALLLLEIARADTEIDTIELDAIKRAIVASSPSIEPDEIEEIITAARQDVEVSISLHEQIRQINTGFSRAQKISLIEQMWRIAYADGDLDKYEEYTIRQLSDLIYVEHKEFIRAKLRVVEGTPGQP